MDGTEMSWYRLSTNISTCGKNYVYNEMELRSARVLTPIYGVELDRIQSNATILINRYIWVFSRTCNMGNYVIHI